MTGVQTCALPILHAGPRKGFRPAFIRYLNPVSSQPTSSHESDYEEDDSDIDYESPLTDGECVVIVSENVL